MSFQIYRNTSIGESLMESIEELCADGRLPEEMAVSILQQFDESMSVAVKKMVTGKANMKAEVSHYKYNENVWTFNLKNVEFKLNPSGSGSMGAAVNTTVQTAKVVVVDAKLAEANV